MTKRIISGVAAVASAMAAVSAAAVEKESSRDLSAKIVSAAELRPAAGTFWLRLRQGRA